MVTYWVVAIVLLAAFDVVVIVAIAVDALDAVRVGVAGLAIASFGFLVKKASRRGSLDRWEVGGVGMQITGALLVVASAIGAVVVAIR